METKRSVQIDLIKGLAIIAVVTQHTLRLDIQIAIGSNFHIYQAVPIFILLMGLNSARSFKARGLTSLREMYSRGQLLRRYKRLLIPLFIAFNASLVLGIWMTMRYGPGQLYFGPFSLLGNLPTPGTGNYFIGLALQFVLVFPLLYWLYRKKPWLMLVSAFAIDAAFVLLASRSGIICAYPKLYAWNILRFLSIIALGIWLSDGMSLRSRRNAFLVPGIVISIAYLAANQLYGWNMPHTFPVARTQLFLTFFYPVLLVIVGMRYLPAKLDNKPTALLAKVGIASFNIYLVNELLFGSGWPLHFIVYKYGIDVHLSDAWLSLVTVLINLSFCLIVGLAFYFGEASIRKKFGIQ